jgi:hypothetical protein
MKLVIRITNSGELFLDEVEKEVDKRFVSDLGFHREEDKKGPPKGTRIEEMSYSHHLWYELRDPAKITVATVDSKINELRNKYTNVGLDCYLVPDQ